MPSKLDTFVDAFNYYDVGDNIMDESIVQQVLYKSKRFGEDLLENIQENSKKIFSDKHPTIPPTLVKTISETAYLENSASALNEVTKPELQEHTSASKIFENINYGIRDFSVTAKYKDSEHRQIFGLRLGDKNGLSYTKQKGSTSYTVSVEQNIYNGKTTGEYTISNPNETYGVSIFQKDGKLGSTVHYGNKKGMFGAVSYDSDNIAASIGYQKQFSDCKLSVRAFVSKKATGFDNFFNSNDKCVTGICGSITL